MTYWMTFYYHNLKLLGEPFKASHHRYLLCMHNATNEPTSPASSEKPSRLSTVAMEFWLACFSRSSFLGLPTPEAILTAELTEGYLFSLFELFLIVLIIKFALITLLFYYFYYSTIISFPATHPVSNYYNRLLH